MEYADIFSDFISRAGTFTIKHCSRLPGSSRRPTTTSRIAFEARTALSSTYDAGRFVVLKSKVNPSQRAPDLANKAWNITGKDGEIVSAQSTCKSG